MSVAWSTHARAGASLLTAATIAVAGCGSTPDRAPDLRSSAAGCTSMTFQNDAQRVAAFEFSDLQHGYDWVDQIGSVAAGSTEATSNVLTYQFWHLQSAAEPALPHDATLSASAAYETCTDCLALNVDSADPGDASSGVLYFGQGGSITATALDHAAATGTIAVAGADLHLVEWDLEADAAVADGRCVDVASFDWTAAYDDTAADLGPLDMAL